MVLSEKVGCRYVIVETDQANVDFYVNCDFKLGKTLEEDKGRAMWMYQRITIE